MLPRFSIALRRRTSTPWSRHHLRAAREVDAEDRRQQLGAQADGQRDREEQRLHGRAPVQHVHDEDERAPSSASRWSAGSRTGGCRDRTPSPAAAASGCARWRRTAGRRPVATMRQRAVPLRTFVPRKTQLARARERWRQPPPAPARFSTGKVSPVRTASLTSSRWPPSERRRPAPGCRRTGRPRRRERRPPRQSVAARLPDDLRSMVNRSRSRAMASRAPRSRQKPTPVLVSMMARTTALSVTRARSRGAASMARSRATRSWPWSRPRSCRTGGRGPVRDDSDPGSSMVVGGSEHRAIVQSAACRARRAERGAASAGSSAAPPRPDRGSTAVVAWGRAPGCGAGRAGARRGLRLRQISVPTHI